ncbi:MAG: rRNA pseudouridine synthase [Actinomycetaceae bacterium]|nr:rRNA pseudouridine synthase [Actinomycetaceae bacterium]
MTQGERASSEQGAREQGERLQKVLAHAGVASRRACEDLITAGRVEVDGEIVTTLGTRIDPQTAHVKVDGMTVVLNTNLVTLALYKPYGVYSTMEDELGRENLSKFVADRAERLYHVGRLDHDTEGLILLTNDGELAHRLAHPSYEVPKTYIARVEGEVSRKLQKVMTQGITLKDGKVKADRFIVREARPRNSIIEITLHSGKNRIVRRMMGEVGHPVMELVRTKFGTVELGHLKPGRTRQVAGNELSALMNMVGM